MAAVFVTPHPSLPAAGGACWGEDSSHHLIVEGEGIFQATKLALGQVQGRGCGLAETCSFCLFAIFLLLFCSVTSHTLPTFMPSKHTRLGNRMQGRNGDRLGQAGGKGRPSGQRAWRAIWGGHLGHRSHAGQPFTSTCGPGSGVPALPVSSKQPPIHQSNHLTMETKVIARLFSFAKLSDL